MAVSPTLTQNTLSNATQDLRGQCKIVVYNWATNQLTLNQGDDSGLADSTAIDVSSQLLSATFSKSMSGPSGSFSFSLSNSPEYGSGDWKDIIKRGSWCVIYMSQEGDLLLSDQVGPPSPNAKKLQENKHIRCIGFIDRVSVRAELGENGAFDVVYDVTGRDFGVVYEDTSIWHNVFQFDQIMLQSLHDTQLNVNSDVKINKVIELIHNLFFNPKAVPGAKVNSNSSLLSIALQWLMPRRMLQDIAVPVDSSPYWGELKVLNLSPTEANMAVSQPLDFLSGNAWETLKRVSIPAFHELFTETDANGFPKLIFRPIPFALDKSKYPTVGNHVMLYKDLPVSTIPAIDVIDFNVGEDNHGRYNSFLATVQTTLIGVEDNVSILQPSGFPKFVQDSIKRYGFRPMHVTIDSLVKNAEKSDGRSNSKILIEYNWLLFDYWNNAVFAESGEFNLIGRNNIKVGQCINFDQHTPYVYGKRYYVEGYTDTFLVEENGVGTWTQTVMATRGFEEQDLLNGNSFGTRDTAFTHQGEYTAAGTRTSKKSKT